MFSQKQLYIEYNIGEEDGKGYLMINDTLSIWQEVFNADENSDIIKIPSDYKIFLVKRLKYNYLYHSSKAFDRVFMISDSLHPMKWTLEKETKEILGYKCKSATTIHRGRKYKAYYTTKISASNGPWKFGGLPGLILQIISFDEVTFNFKATKIQNQLPSPVDIPPFEPEKFITWQSFKQKYEELAKSHIAKLKAKQKPGDTGRLLFLTREVIYPPINSGQGIKIE